MEQSPDFYCSVCDVFDFEPHEEGRCPAQACADSFTDKNDRSQMYVCNLPAGHGTVVHEQRAANGEIIASWAKNAPTSFSPGPNPPDASKLVALVKAAKVALRWLGDPDDALGTFEDIADWFRHDTGYLRPGKSEPLECGDRTEEREQAWKAWRDHMNIQVRKDLRDALFELEGRKAAAVVPSPPRTPYEKWPPKPREGEEPSDNMKVANRLSEWIANRRG